MLLYIGKQGSKLLTASDMIISITFKDSMLLCFVFSIKPAFQAGRAKLLLWGRGCESCGTSEPMATTSKSAKYFPQLAICHATEIILKVYSSGAGQLEQIHHFGVTSSIMQT